MTRPAGLATLAVAQGQARDALDAATVREAVLDVGDARTLSGAEELASLEVLTLHGAKALDLGGLAPLRRLRWLRVGAYTVSGLEALEALPLDRLEVVAHRQAALTGLRSETLRSLWVWNSGLRELPGVALPRLRHLDLSMNKLADLGFLRGMSSLRSVDVSENPVTDASGLLALEGLRSLRLPDLRTAKDKAVAAALARHPAVRDPSEERALLPWGEAAVRDGWAEREDLATLSSFDAAMAAALPWEGAGALPALRVLLTTGCEALEPGGAPELVWLHVRSGGEWPDAITPALGGLAQLPHLHRLILDCPLSSLDQLPELPSVRHLELKEPRMLVDFEGVERLPRLSTVKTSSCDHRDAGRLTARGILVTR
jgi:hypothetical protein